MNKSLLAQIGAAAVFPVIAFGIISSEEFNSEKFLSVCLLFFGIFPVFSFLLLTLVKKVNPSFSDGLEANYKLALLPTGLVYFVCLVIMTKSVI